ncbi:MAG: DUF4131 domain-containing protein, partial [Armatimonadetes bacterium]|nr:DUF4131 domain-containing protein [Armatimonadota bacterium]
MSFIILTTLAYILGIILAHFFIISYKIIFFILLFIIILSISGIIFSWKRNFILILLGFMLCGILIFNLNLLKISFDPLKFFTGKLAILNGQIIDFPQKKEEQTSFILKINKINEQPQNSLIKVFLTSKEQLNFSYGDLISLKGILEDIPPPKFPGDFNYKKYLNYQGIKQIIYL